MGELQIVTLLSLPTFSWSIGKKNWSTPYSNSTSFHFPPSKKTPRFYRAYTVSTPSFPPPRPIPNSPLQSRASESPWHTMFLRLGATTNGISSASAPCSTCSRYCGCKLCMESLREVWSLVGSFVVFFTKTGCFNGRINPNTLHVTGICTYV